MAPRSFLKDLTGVFSSNIFIILAGLLVSVILTTEIRPGWFGIYSAILVHSASCRQFRPAWASVVLPFTISAKNNSNKRDIVAGILLILVMTSILGIIITGAGFCF